MYRRLCGTDDQKTLILSHSQMDAYCRDYQTLLVKAHFPLIEDTNVQTNTKSVQCLSKK